MNGAFHAPPLTVPSVFADRQSRRESPKMASRPFQFLEKKRSKIRKRAAKHFEGLAALSTHSTGRRAAVKTGCKPVHFSLDGCPLSCYFPGVWPLLRDTLSTSRSVGRGTGAFIYALSADENRPALAAPRHTSTALFSCRFKCPCPPRRQRHFHGNADRAYNTLHFASQSRVPNGGVAPFGNPHKKRRYATPPRGAYRLFLLSSPPAVSVEQKSAWEWCGIFI